MAARHPPARRRDADSQHRAQQLVDPRHRQPELREVQQLPEAPRPVARLHPRRPGPSDRSRLTLGRHNLIVGLATTKWCKRWWATLPTHNQVVVALADRHSSHLLSTLRPSLHHCRICSPLFLVPPLHCLICYPLFVPLSTVLLALHGTSLILSPPSMISIDSSSPPLSALLPSPLRYNRHCKSADTHS